MLINIIITQTSLYFRISKFFSLTGSCRLYRKQNGGRAIKLKLNHDSNIIMRIRLCGGRSHASSWFEPDSTLALVPSVLFFLSVFVRFERVPLLDGSQGCMERTMCSSVHCSSRKACSSRVNWPCLVRMSSFTWAHDDRAAPEKMRRLVQW